LLARCPARFDRVAACVGLGAALQLAACAAPARCPARLIQDPAQALAAQQARGAGIRSLRAEARVDQRGRGGRIKGRVMMFVERPDRVRFDAVTQFGPALTLTSDGSQFALSDFKAGRYLHGPACEQNLARMLGVALSGRDVAIVLLGESPPITARDQSLRCEGGRYLLERRAVDGGRQELELRVEGADRDAPPEAQRLYLVRASFWDAAGKPLYRVRYEDYEPTGGAGAALPRTVRIDDYVNDADALLRFSTLDVDVDVPADAFVQTPRAGLSVEELSCE
jgi:hypothetical protein